MDTSGQSVDDTSGLGGSDLIGLLAFVRRRWRTIATIALVTTVATLAVSLSRADRYAATARVLYSAPGTGGIAGDDTSRAVDTFVRLATTDEVLEPVVRARRLGSVATLRDNVSATADPNANLISIRAEASDAEAAAGRANGVAGSLVEWQNDRRDLQRQAEVDAIVDQIAALRASDAPSAVAATADLQARLAELRSELKTPPTELILVSPASPPDAAFSPKWLRDALVALLAGIVLGLLIAAATNGRGRVRRRAPSLESVEALYPWPVLGAIPLLDANDPSLDRVDLAWSATAAAYRSARTRMVLTADERWPTQRGNVWVVAAATRGEGATTVAANLAGAFATASARTLAISADLRLPALHRQFGIRGGSGSSGLAGVLAGDRSLEEAAVVGAVTAPGVGTTAPVAVLASDTRATDPAALIGLEVMRDLVEEARGGYDAVVIDAPAFVESEETALLSRLADGFVLVVRLDQANEQHAQRARRLLDDLGITPVGLVVIGGVPIPDPVQALPAETRERRRPTARRA